VTESSRYEGLVTRAIAFAIDAAIVDLIALLVGVTVGLALSILPIGDTATVVLVAAGGAAFLVWTLAYFAVFWSTTGQTPGSRLMQIRVLGEDGERLKPRRAVLRFGALVLAALPLFAGFLTILVDARRRGLHDMLARTVVVRAPATAAPVELTLGVARPLDSHTPGTSPVHDWSGG
jgi:uncharacterized RDD family membrane protein YckC